jgi:hypothetical protein
LQRNHCEKREIAKAFNGARASCLCGHQASLPGGQNFNSAGETPAGPAAKMATLHYPSAQQFVLSGQQILHESVAALVRVARCAGKMLIDSHPGGATKIICNRENFIGWFPLT